MYNNYPPGVTGNEVEIAGAEHHPRCPMHEDNFENHEEECPFIDEDSPSDMCDCPCTCSEEEEADYYDAGERRMDAAREDGW